jgi:hypothetical protein
MIKSKLYKQQQEQDEGNKFFQVSQTYDKYSYQAV